MHINTVIAKQRVNPLLREGFGGLPFDRLQDSSW